MWYQKLRQGYPVTSFVSPPETSPANPNAPEIPMTVPIKPNEGIAQSKYLIIDCLLSELA